MEHLRLEELTRENQAAVRDLILQGLEQRWGSLDPTLNTDLDDMLAAYGHGWTAVLFDGESVVATGTLLPHAEGAEVRRMSVDVAQQRTGLGRHVVELLMARAGQWGAPVVVLETSTAWTSAVDFYLSCGFAITHTEEGAFGHDTWFRRNVTP